MDISRINPIEIIDNVLHRLECLTIDSLPQYPGSSFPSLKRLTIKSDSNYGDVVVSDINSTRFPCLSHLICQLNFVKGPTNIPYDPPHLELLSCVITEDPAWIIVLRGCKETLTSLRLGICHYGGEIVEIAQVIKLPKLKQLEVKCWEDQRSTWPLQLKNPILESYSEFQVLLLDYRPLHTDIEQITHLRTNQPILSLSSLRRLQRLDIFQSPASLVPLLLELSADGSLCPELKLIKLRTPVDCCNDIDITDLNKARSQPITIDCEFSTSIPPSIVISTVNITYSLLYLRI